MWLSSGLRTRKSNSRAFIADLFVEHAPEIGRVLPEFRDQNPRPGFLADTAKQSAILLLALILGAQTATAQMSLPGKFAVNSIGAATFSIPISVPPGTAGMSPSLSLDYNNHSGDGIVGVGWTLSGLPAIGRCPRTMAQDGVRGAVNYNVDDRFCLDGQRLVVTNGAYGGDGAEYRTEVESYSQIFSYGSAGSGSGPNWFQVKTKTGQTMEFGRTANSRIQAQGKTTVRSWALNKVKDTAGNYFTVTYAKDTANGHAYPTRVDYTGNDGPGLAPYNAVEFVYAPRPDTTPAYHAGSLLRLTQRLVAIKAFADGALIGQYNLAYRQSPSTNVSLLDSITVCSGLGSCLPSTSLTWTDGDYAQFSGQLAWQDASWNWDGFAPGFADVNGDGKTDLIASTTAGGTWRAHVALSNGDGSFALVAPPWQETSWNWAGFAIAFADINGDGKVDMIASATAGGTWRAHVALGNGNGTFAAAVPWQDATWDWTGFAVSFADVNGDGKADMIASSTAGGTWRAHVALATSAGNFAPAVGWQDATWDWTGFTVAFVDVNGDGKADNVAYATAGGSWRVHVALMREDGTFAPPVAWQDANSNWSGFAVSFADVNGDGKADNVAATTAGGSWRVHVALSRGDGTFAPAVAWQDATWNWTNFGVTFADVNGDGKADNIAYTTAGGAWRTHVALSKGDGSFVPAVAWQDASWNWANFGVTFVDINGDGRADNVAATTAGGSWRVHTALMPAGAFELVGGITTGLGASTSITYAPLSNTAVYSKDSGATYPLVDIQGPMHVVERVDKSNGVGGAYSTSYSYAGAKIDLNGRGLLGFRQMTVTDPQTSVVETKTYRQDYPFIGQVASETKTRTGLTLSATVNAYLSSALGGTRYQVTLHQSDVTGNDLDGSLLPSTTSTFQHDAFGNATQIAVATSHGSSTWTKTTDNTYINDTTRWLLGRLTQSAVTSQNPPP